MFKSGFPLHERYSSASARASPQHAGSAASGGAGGIEGLEGAITIPVSRTAAACDAQVGSGFSSSMQLYLYWMPYKSCVCDLCEFVCELFCFCGQRSFGDTGWLGCVGVCVCMIVCMVV